MITTRSILEKLQEAQVRHGFLAEYPGDNLAVAKEGLSTMSGTEAASVVMQITSSGNTLFGGNVGIGTTSPNIVGVGTALTIQGSGARGVVELSNSSTGTSGIAGSFRAYNGTTGLGSIDVSADGATNSGMYDFYTTNAGIWVDALHISHTGNVGIGNVSPNGVLDVSAGGIGTQTVLAISSRQDNDATSSTALLFANYFGGGLKASSRIVGGRDGVYGGSSSTWSSNLQFLTASAGTELQRMRITSGGNVGIGTTNPGYALEVVGQVAASGPYVLTSDMRRKKDITPMAYGLDTVMKLRPVGFNWKDQSKEWQKAHQIGFIAQEVEPLVPEVVTTANDAEHSKSLAYASLVPVLTKAIQELKAANDNLKADEDKLRADNDRLKANNENQAKALKALSDEFHAYVKAHP